MDVSVCAAWSSSVTLASWILLTGPPSNSPEAFFRPETGRHSQQCVHGRQCVFPFMCVFLCLCVYLSVCPCVFELVSRINNSESSPLSDLCALKVMTGNLSSRRKSILWKSHNFPAKGRIISPRSLVSFEKGVVRIEDRREKVLKNRESTKKISTSSGYRREIDQDQGLTVSCLLDAFIKSTL